MSSMQYTKQMLIEEYPLIQREVEKLKSKLSFCGTPILIKVGCRKCKNEGIENFLKTIKKDFHCLIRLCFETNCILERFASTMEQLRSIKRLSGLRRLWHFAIGFSLLDLEEFQNNFAIHKKRYEVTMRNYFSKARKENVVVEYIRVLDFSFDKIEHGKIYPHYHYGAIPLKSSVRRSSMIKLKAIEKNMNKRMKLNYNFHLQSFGYKSKEAIFNYLAKRACGLYKFNEDKNKDWASGKGKLKEDIENGKYFGLKDVINEEQYINHFYKKRHYVTSSGIPHGSIPTDNEQHKEGCICEKHGKLTPKDVFTVREIDYTPPPPDPRLKMVENDEPFIVKVIKIN